LANVHPGKQRSEHLQLYRRLAVHAFMEGRGERRQNSAASVMPLLSKSELSEWQYCTMQCRLPNFVMLLVCQVRMIEWSGAFHVFRAEGVAMWLRIGLKACLLLIVVATAHRAGWICHELAKWSNYRHGLSAGERLRSNLSGQLRSLDELAALQNQQESARWELEEHRERIDAANAGLIGNDMTALLGSERHSR
jgi:hypothetical protein